MAKATGSDKLQARTIQEDPRWEALRTRDKAADIAFVYGVQTTGVFCRPSCGARLPNPQNVTFFANPSLALAQGYRACKRCRPTEPSRAQRHAQAVASMCRLIEAQEQAPTLATLAAHVDLSPSHAHRIFKAALGLTPRAYAQARRRTRVHSALEHNHTVTEAIYEAGFGSSSRFYEASSQLLGMKPQAFRDGGTAQLIHFATRECTLGHVLVATTQRGVCAIALGDEPQALVHDLERRFPRASLVAADPGFDGLIARVLDLVERPGEGAATDLPLDIRGTAFQQRVWAALNKIPAGRTLTYGELAQAIGQPRASRAVAQACGANPVAVAIPCHRVIRSDGGLSGYRWGVERKRALLKREATPTKDKQNQSST